MRLQQYLRIGLGKERGHENGGVTGIVLLPRLAWENKFTFFFVRFIQEFCLIPAENNHWVWFCYTLSTIFILTPHPRWLFTQHLLFYSSTVGLIASFVIGH